jgi:hypothetical protein
MFWNLKISQRRLNVCIVFHFILLAMEATLLCQLEVCLSSCLVVTLIFRKTKMCLGQLVEFYTDQEDHIRIWWPILFNLSSLVKDETIQ